jgi:putative ABC transport system ATP-binding protein
MKEKINHTMQYAMIQTQSLTKRFKTDEVETTALHEVSLEINQGEFVSIMGPSGCGKSTLLNILGMLDNPSGGIYRFNGLDVSQYTENKRTDIRKAEIGVVFQSFNLIDELNVFENVELPLAYQRVKRSVRKQRVNQVLEQMHIGHRRRHFPQQLSGGQQQRVALCRAIVANPKLILADEPTGNLDSKNGLEVMKLLAELNRQGATVVMVTHSPRDASFAHRIVQLFDGKVLKDKVMQEVNPTRNELVMR